jgi:tellurite methyltransferase
MTFHVIGRCVDANRRHRWTERHRSSEPPPPPTPFVVCALAVLARSPSPGRRALDVACGRGRHALLLAQQGYDVTAVDYALPALTALRETARSRGLPIRCLAADVTTWPLPRAYYDLVVVVSFLERDLVPALRNAVAPGGTLLMETFLADGAVNPNLHPDFLLAPGELDALCHGWEILVRTTGSERHGDRIAARDGVLARRPQGAVAH